MYLVNLSIFSFILSLLIYLKLIPFLKKRLLDTPIKRSTHKLPTPTGGGIVFGFIGSLFSAINGFYVPFIAFPIGIIGLIDDKYDIPSLIRYLSQILICFFLFYESPLQDKLIDYPVLLIFPIIIFIGTAIINFCNFIDGLDGLLISCMVIVFFTLSFGQISIMPLITSMVAFLIYNWHPAKIFMGDAGSTFIGAVFFGLLMQIDSHVELLKSLFLITPILADCSICIIRRYICGENIFKAHKLHLFQRLHQAGWSQFQVVMLYVIGVTLLSFTFLTKGITLCLVVAIIEIFIGFYLDKNCASKFLNT